MMWLRQRRIRNDESGITMIEVLIAFVIFAILSVGLTFAMISDDQASIQISQQEAAVTANYDALAFTRGGSCGEITGSESSASQNPCYDQTVSMWCSLSGAGEPPGDPCSDPSLYGYSSTPEPISSLVPAANVNTLLSSVVVIMRYADSQESGNPCSDYGSAEPDRLLRTATTTWHTIAGWRTQSVTFISPIPSSQSVFHYSAPQNTSTGGIVVSGLSSGELVTLDTSDSYASEVLRQGNSQGCAWFPFLLPSETYNIVVGSNQETVNVTAGQQTIVQAP